MKVCTVRWRLFFTVASIILMMMPFVGAQRPTSRPADGHESFQFRDRPIHPACVMTLGTELADGLPAVGAVDVEGCTESQQHPAEFAVRDGWISIELKDGGAFSYRHLGVSPGGTHVLETHNFGGGTGVFEDLLLVRVHRDRVRQDDKIRDRLLMTSVGSFVLGDRDDGVIRLDGNRLIVGRSRYRKRDTIISLDQAN